MPSESFDKYALNIPRRSVTVHSGPSGDSRSESITGYGTNKRVSRSRTWSNTPGFKQRAKRDLPVNSMTVAENDLEGYMATSVWKEIYYRPEGNDVTTILRDIAGLDGFSASFPAADFSDARAIATSKVLAEVRQERWSAPIFMAESAKSMKMIADTARRLAFGYTSLRRGDIASFATTFGVHFSRARRKRFQYAFGRDPRQAAQNAWLESTYGWRPLLHDVYDAAGTVAQLRNVDYNRLFSARGVGVTKRTYSTPRTAFEQSEYELFHRVKLGVVYRFASGQPPVAAHLGLLNPLEVAWELTPFSFVVDWFVPIGDYIQQIGATPPGLHTFVRGYESKTYLGTQRWSYSEHAVEDLIFFGTRRLTTYDLERHITAKTRQFWRSPLGDFPSPTMKPLKLPQSWQQAASAIALLGQKFRR